VVKQLTWERVQRVRRDVVIGKEDYIVWVKAVGDKDVIGVADVCLVTVVPIAVRTGH
jgi:hypothetical protein